jgi:hypothetical protein
VAIVDLVIRRYGPNNSEGRQEETAGKRGSKAGKKQYFFGSQVSDGIRGSPERHTRRIHREIKLRFAARCSNRAYQDRIDPGKSSFRNIESRNVVGRRQAGPQRSHGVALRIGAVLSVSSTRIFATGCRCPNYHAASVPKSVAAKAYRSELLNVQIDITAATLESIQSLVG